MAIGRGTATGRKRQFDPAPPVAAIRLKRSAGQLRPTTT